ncbi:hypothetical protein [Halosimplex pelagicum]|uniref:Uncharacterized protein n=1 Tax=Halosimplex pelagicum TaxID=869886 RepID=A0A7D5PAA9_9EURY|nr:hypothetical protein [Halosimplex pelagicum]QLH81685.1 hypothetical protein HZS54_08625 [Halosimplex pelagicum]
MVVAYVKGTGDTGFDVVACEDENDDGDCDADTFHIIEAKFKCENGGIGKGWLDKTKRPW